MPSEDDLYPGGDGDRCVSTPGGGVEEIDVCPLDVVGIVGSGDRCVSTPGGDVNLRCACVEL